MIIGGIIDGLTSYNVEEKGIDFVDRSPISVYDFKNEKGENIGEKLINTKPTGEISKKEDTNKVILKNFHDFLKKEIQFKAKIEDMVSTKEEITRELAGEIEENQAIKIIEQVPVVEVKKCNLNEQELEYYAKNIIKLDKYGAQSELTRYIIENPISPVSYKIMENLHLQPTIQEQLAQELNKISLEESYNKGEITQVEYINMYLQKCSLKGGISILDLRKMFKNINVECPSDYELEQGLVENKFIK